MAAGGTHWNPCIMGNISASTTVQVVPSFVEVEGRGKAKSNTLKQIQDTLSLETDTSRNELVHGK
jgi:hypothetical protein